MPRVSVLIPTFNRASTICRAVDSVFSQTYKDFECLVIDDASRDETLDLLDSYDDSRLKLIQLEKNYGVSRARNEGFKKSSGQWIALLDSDDEWLPQRLEKQLLMASENRKYPLIHGEEIWIRRGKRVNPKNKHRKSGGRIFQNSLPLCLISPSATLMKRSLYEQMGGFREDFPVCEDYELWLRVTQRYDVGFISDPLIVKYGGHSDQLSQKYKAMDYWRVKAMEELFHQRKKEMSKEDQRVLIKTLLEKCLILKKGYEKHQNRERLPYINSLWEEFSSFSYDEEG